MWKLAWRQIFRQRARTLITGSAIALAFALYLISTALGDGMYGKMMKAAERAAGGGVLVHAEGYWESRGSNLLVTDPDLIASVARKVPGVRGVAPRVLVEGLVTSADGAVGARVQGIVPAAERPLQDLSKHLSAGAFLDDDDPRAIVLGAKLADDLDVALGDRLVLHASDATGERFQALFRLRGIVSTGSDALDAQVAFVRLATLQRATRAGAGATQLGVLVDHDARIDAVRDALKRDLGARAPGIELLTWAEAMPDLLGFIEMDSGMNEAFSLIIFVIVAFGIANTFLMSVIERVRELGLLGALGLTPWRIGALVLRESLLLALLSMSIGFGLAYGTHAYFAEAGLDYGAFLSSDLEISGIVLDDLVIYSRLEAAKWLTAAAVVTGLILLSALYPAWRATRLDPAVAMRTYE